MDLIKATTFDQWNFRLSTTDLVFYREHRFANIFREIDVYGKFWGCFFIEHADGGVKIFNGSDSIRLSGSALFFFPPHSIIEWEISRPTLNWYAFASVREYPSSYPSFPTVFTDLNLRELLRGAPLNLNAGQPVKYETQYSGAESLKNKLDQEFSLNKGLDSYAHELQLSKETLVRNFKKTYAITPIVYRNKKRVFQSMFDLLMTSQTIVDVSHNNGFEDLSHFYELFKRITSTTPKNYSSPELAPVI